MVFDAETVLVLLSVQPYVPESDDFTPVIKVKKKYMSYALRHAKRTRIASVAVIPNEGYLGD